MPLIRYENTNPNDSTLALIAKAVEICEEYDAQGYDLTLRQLYYQFVARGLLPNKQREYNRLGRAVSTGRMIGAIDWDYITDRTRNLQGRTTWGSPREILAAAANGYARDRWATQPKRVEVWVEKEALAGVIQQTADRQFVDYLACRGYMSQSEMWAASQRLLSYLDEGVEKIVILHLGDHDPSGMDMSRDIEDRLYTFMASRLVRLGYDVFEDAVTVDRIALNMDQVRQYSPPPNPAKLTDSRAGDYITQYGGSSWELDALDPATLDALITREVQRHRDDTLWQAEVDRERSERELIRELADGIQP